MPTYHSASGSVAEDLFIELFSEAFGAEKAGYLYSQYHYNLQCFDCFLQKAISFKIFIIKPFGRLSV